MIKAIIFDAGGVLKNSVDQYVNEDIKTTLNINDKKFQEHYESRVLSIVDGTKTEREFWRLVLEALNKSYFPEIDELLSREFERHSKKNGQVSDLAQQLKDAGYKIAILSNTCPSHRAVNERLGIYDGFDERIFSYEVRLKKPDRQIYELTLDRLNVAPDETVFIDDSIEYVKGANSVGIHGVHFTGYEALVRDLRQLNVKI